VSESNRIVSPSHPPCCLCPVPQADRAADDGAAGQGGPGGGAERGEGGAHRAGGGAGGPGGGDVLLPAPEREGRGGT